MNTYVAIYKGKRIEVFAYDLFSAKCKALSALKVTRKDSGLLSITLTATTEATTNESTPVIHSTSML